MVSFNKETRLKNFVKGISVTILYFLVNMYITLPLELLHIDYNSLSLSAKIFYNVSIEIMTIAIIYLVFMEQINEALKDLKQNHFTYFSKNFKFYLLGAFLMMAANSLINILGGGLSGNESAVRDQFALAPIYTFFSAVFLAPLVEEGIFRLAFRNIFKNNIVFICASGLIFGGLHLLSGVDLEFLPLHLVAYCSFGFVFAYMLTKTNNIFVTIGFHMMHNGILMSLQVFLLLFG